MSRQGEQREPTSKNILNFWEREAGELGDTPQVTIRDFYFRIHELATLIPLIPFGSRMLDVGCGTGFGTMILAQRASYACGVDFSEKMIEWAVKLRDDEDYKKRMTRRFSPFWSIGDSPKGGMDFACEDVLALNLMRERFDAICGQRMLINLLSHDHQLIALRNLRRHASEAAILLLVEATKQGHRRTDAFRAEVGLPMLEKYWHNHYVNEDAFGDWEDCGWKVENVLSFDAYTLLSKVIYPAAVGPENCQFLSAANAAAMELACVFRSRSAVEEVGVARFMSAYVARVRRYDVGEATRIERWLESNLELLSDWRGLGHQKLIIGRAI